MPLMPTTILQQPSLTTCHVETGTPAGTTSGTLEDVANMSTTISLANPGHVVAFASFQISTQSGAAPSVIAVAISIDGVDGREASRYLSGSNDIGMGAIVERTDSPLAAGTYTVKLRFRRVSGAATPGIDVASLVAVS